MQVVCPRLHYPALPSLPPVSALVSTSLELSTSCVVIAKLLSATISSSRPFPISFLLSHLALALSSLLSLPFSVPSLPPLLHFHSLLLSHLPSFLSYFPCCRSSVGFCNIDVRERRCPPCCLSQLPAGSSSERRIFIYLQWISNKLALHFLFDGCCDLGNREILIGLFWLVVIWPTLTLARVDIANLLPMTFKSPTKLLLVGAVCRNIYINTFQLRFRCRHRA